MKAAQRSPWLPDDIDAALYLELVPIRPSPALHDREAGPSALLMQLERERALWDAASHDDEKGAA